MTRIIDLPNPFEPAVAPGSGAAVTTLSPSPLVTAATFTSREASATNAPGMARDVIEMPAFLQRNPDNSFRFPVTSEA